MEGVNPKPLDLLQPAAMPPLGDLAVPHDFYWVLAAPAPLAGMAYPAWPPRWNEMHAAGFRQVLCLTAEMFPYDPAPLHPLLAVGLTDLYGGRWPADPPAEQARIRAAAAQVLACLERGEGVVVHCEGGTGRTGTVLGCVLRALGLGGGEVVQYLDGLHKRRGRAGWPESDWQAKVVKEL